MNEKELLATLVEFYRNADIPENKITSHLYHLHLSMLEEFYKDREGLFVLHSGERVEAFDVDKLRASIELASDNGKLALSTGDIEQLVRLSLKKIQSNEKKLIPARILRRSVTDAMQDLGFHSLAIIYKSMRPDK